jgi:hypothetical protein
MAPARASPWCRFLDGAGSGRWGVPDARDVLAVGGDDVLGVGADEVVAGAAGDVVDGAIDGEDRVVAGAADEGV